ncbi:phospholipase A1-like [Eurosta solidaginis]|uniref:phospholipase A1-like n=1 Tax=Eurosta solidaginis TaxID=178769 RepID=UPI0035305C54
MKVWCFFAALVLAVTAVPIPEEERASGVNGWYVPQINGTEQWVTLKEGEIMLAELEEQENRNADVYDNENPHIMGRFSTVPVTFYLFTNKNPIKAQKITATKKSIDISDFDGSKRTRLLIHGWFQSHKSSMNSEIRSAWLSSGNYNVIIVDWGRARGEYVTAVAAVSKVGDKVASLIDYLVENYGMNLNETQVIGHSLGAHVAGYAGKNIKNGMLQAIVALDAALPLFSYNKPNKRLSVNDAQYVEGIHTNGGGLGYLQPLGKADFYPNGGKSQPGCFWDLTGACDHARSFAYYAEAVARDSFTSMRCADYQQAVKNNCGGSYSSVKMGAETNCYVVSGEYYVPVHSASPFGFALGA